MNVNDKNEQTNVFVEMINVIDEEQFMQEQIEALTELEKVKLVNRMLIKMGSTVQLFEPEGKKPIHPGVLHETYKNLIMWMKKKQHFERRI